MILSQVEYHMKQMRKFSIHCRYVYVDIEFNLDYFFYRMDTYGKCGDLNSAREIYNKFKIKTKPIISSMSKSFKRILMNFYFLTLVNIYGINSHALEAVTLFYETKEKLSGNIESILISVLTACAHGGLVEEAQKIFDEIPKEKRSVKMWNTLVSHLQDQLEFYINFEYRSMFMVVLVNYLKLIRLFINSKKLIPVHRFYIFHYWLLVVLIKMRN